MEGQNELHAYLSEKYPVESPLWILLRVAIMNDYHRRCRDEMLVAIDRHDKKLSKDLFMCKLIGGFAWDAYDWLRLIDAPLTKMINTKEKRDFFVAYLQMEGVQKNQDKVVDAIQGEGYSENLRETVRKVFDKDLAAKP